MGKKWKHSKAGTTSATVRSSSWMTVLSCCHHERGPSSFTMNTSECRLALPARSPLRSEVFQGKLPVTYWRRCKTEQGALAKEVVEGNTAARRPSVGGRNVTPSSVSKILRFRRGLLHATAGVSPPRGQNSVWKVHQLPQRDSRASDC